MIYQQVDLFVTGTFKYKWIDLPHNWVQVKLVLLLKYMNSNEVALIIDLKEEEVATQISFVSLLHTDPRSTINFIYTINESLWK